MAKVRLTLPNKNARDVLVVALVDSGYAVQKVEVDEKANGVPRKKKTYIQFEVKNTDIVDDNEDSEEDV